MMDARGEAGRGLTDASFVGNVDYREAVSAARPSTSSGRAEPGPGRALREARSNALEVALRPGMSAIDEARFSGVVRFEEGALAATGATARYLVDRGIVELRGGDGPMIPHVVNPQIAVDAAAIDLTFLGPKMKATGSVKSLLKPEAAGAEKGQTRMPAMLKQDQPVNVVSDALAYDGTVSTARYSGNAQLWQGDTSIRAPSIDIDARSGDLAADGADGTVTTSVMLDQTNATTKAQERVRSLGTSKAFKYDDGARRATYTGDAHLSGPEGDLTAPKIELYLKPSGNELERAEAYEEVTLRESGRTTTGTRMTYFADTERYLVVGSPVKVVDECGGETVGRTLTFDKNADTIVLDGRKQFRTQSKGASKCG
jgi:lipopolysaccharide export system protein LptA